MATKTGNYWINIIGSKFKVLGKNKNSYIFRPFYLIIQMSWNLIKQILCWQWFFMMTLLHDLLEDFVFTTRKFFIFFCSRYFRYNKNFRASKNRFLKQFLPAHRSEKFLKYELIFRPIFNIQVLFKYFLKFLRYKKFVL